MFTAAFSYFRRDCCTVLVNPCNFETDLKNEGCSSFRIILLNLGKMGVTEKTVIFHRLAVKTGDHL